MDENSAVGVEVGAPITADLASDEDTSDDPDWKIESFEITNGDSNSRFAISSTGQITVAKAELDKESQGQYVLTVEVTDGGGLTDSAVVTINIGDVNEDPSLSDTTFSIPENSAADTNVGTPLSGQFSDADNAPPNDQIKSFEITDGNTGDAFKIVASSGQLQVNIQSELDRETKPQYILEVLVRDDGTPERTATATITINLSDVNEDPTLADVTLSIAEDASLGDNVGAPLSTQFSDGDSIAANKEIKDFSIDDAVPSNPFSVVASTGQLKVNAALNREAVAQYVLTVSVRDNGTPVGSDTAVVTVDITDVNEAPTFADATLSIPENSPADESVGSPLTSLVSDADSGPDNNAIKSFEITDGNTPEAFKITSPGGQLQVFSQNALDREAKAQYVLTVLVRDKGTPEQSDSAQITINLADVNEPPTFEDVVLSVAENVEVGTSVGDPLTNQASDGDLGENATLSFDIEAGDDDGVFGFGVTNGQLVVEKAELDRESTSQYVLTIRVFDGGTPSLSAIADVTVDVTDVNEPPVFSNITVHVAENSAAGTDIGAPLMQQVVDSDEGQNSVIQGFAIIDGDENGAFSVTSGGQLEVENQSELDHETTAEYVLRVRVTDGGAPENLSTDANITIIVDDVNEGPTLDGGQTRSVTENSDVGTEIGQKLSASDPDLDGPFASLSFSLDAGASALFAVSADGQLSVAEAEFDYEAADSYEVPVTVTDGGGLTSSNTVAVSVLDANDLPVAQHGTADIDENLAVGSVVTCDSVCATVSDGDNSEELTWSFTGAAVPFEFNGLPAVAALSPGTRSSIDFKTTASLNFELVSTYNVSLLVTDSGGAEVETWSLINVVDENDAPVAVDVRRDVFENASIGTPILPTLKDAVSDEDDPDKSGLSFSIVSESGDHDGKFAIPETDGILVVADGVNFEAKAEYIVVVRVTDTDNSVKQNGPLSVEFSVIVTVVNVNEVPLFPNATRSIREHAAVGDTIGAPLDVVDPDGLHPWGNLEFSIIAGDELSQFVVDDEGQLAVAAPLDYEDIASYNLTLRVTDEGLLSDTAFVVVTVEDENDRPILDNFEFDVDENSPTGTLIGTELGAFDEDVAQTLTYSIIGGEGTDIFVVDEESGQLSVNKTQLNFESVASYNITVRVVDDGSPILSASAWIVVDINDVNEVPTIADQHRAIDENSDVGDTVGDPIVADDVDTANGWGALEFTISGGDDEGLLSIDTSSGQLCVARALLDFEEPFVPNPFVLNVTVTDGGPQPLVATAVVVVDVVDINDAPQLLGGLRGTDENRGYMSFIGAPLIDLWSDQDTPVHGDLPVFSIDADSSGGIFGIRAADGQLFVEQARLNFEDVSNHTLVVRVTDDGPLSPHNLSATAIVYVEVYDVNDKPEVSAGTYSVRENVASGTYVGAVVAVDQDWNQTLTYSITGGDPSSHFSVDAATGHLYVDVAALDFEAVPQYELNVTAVDDAVPRTWADWALMEIAVIDRNDKPVMGNQSFTIIENVPVGTAASPLVAVFDEDRPGAPQTLSFIDVRPINFPVNDTVVFDVNRTSGALYLANGTLNHEETEQYVVRVTVVDSPNENLPGGATALQPMHAFATAFMNITVLDENEHAVLTKLFDGDRLNVDEGVAVNTAVEGSFAVYDPDDAVLELKVFEVVDGIEADSQWFEFNNATSEIDANGLRPNVHLVVRKEGLPPDFQSLNLQAVDPVNASHSSEKLSVTVDIADRNDAPEWVGAGPFTHAESTEAGASLGLLTAFDKDADQALTFSVTGREPIGGRCSAALTDADYVPAGMDDYFTTEQIVPETGPSRSAQLILVQQALDYESLAVYAIEIEVEDDGFVNIGYDENGERIRKKETPANVKGCVELLVTDVDDVPVVNSVSIRSTFGLSTAGGESVTLGGRNFGSDVPARSGFRVQPRGTYTNGNVTFVSTSCTVTVAFREIVCTSVEGYGASFVWRVGTEQVSRVDMPSAGIVQWSEYSENSVSYAKPNIAAFVGADKVTTAGNSVVRINGTQFGTVEHNAVTQVTYGPSGDEYDAIGCYVSVSHEQLTCRTSPGIGSGLLWVVSIGYQNSLTPVTSYGNPVIYAIRGPGAVHGDTNGNQTIWIDGTNFGNQDDPVGPPITSVVYGGVDDDGDPIVREQWFRAGSCFVSITDTEITCLSAEGTGKNLHWIVTIAGQDSAVSDAVTSYAPPQLGSPGQLCAGVAGSAGLALVVGGGGSVEALPTEGGVTVTVCGRNFGGKSAPRQVYFGENVGELALVAHISHEELQFVLPRGSGRDKEIYVWVDEQESGRQTVSYGAPEVLDIDHVKGTKLERVTIKLTGRNFAQCCFARASGLVYASGTCECAKDGVGGVIGLSSWINTTAGDHMACMIDPITVTDMEFQCETDGVVPDGLGTLFVSAGGQISPPIPYSYRDLLNLPKIDAVFCGDVLCDGQVLETTGYPNATIRGSNFGTSGVVIVTQLKLHAELPHVSYNDEEIVFDLPPALGTLGVVVSIMGKTRQSTAVFVEYAAPQAERVTPSEGFSSGNTKITITGRNFGPGKDLNGGYFFHSAAHWDEGGARPDDVKLSRVVLEDFGAQTQRECRVTFWSHTEIKCDTPPGFDVAHPVVVLVSQMCDINRVCNPETTEAQPTLGASLMEFSYAAPVVTSISPSHGRTRGGQLIVVEGTSFSTAQDAPALLYLGRPPEIDGEVPFEDTDVSEESTSIRLRNVVLQTHTRIEFITESGSNVNWYFQVGVAGQLSKLTSLALFSYDPPQVFSIASVADAAEQDLSCPAGEICVSRSFNAHESELIITGTNFGTSVEFLGEEANLKILIGEDECTRAPGRSSVWLSDDNLQCQIREVTVGPKDIFVNISHQSAYIDESMGLRSECRAGFYGVKGERCLLCPPEGAECPGLGQDPYAVEQYWGFNRTSFVPCQPRVACAGNNTCSIGYTGTACTVCVKGNFYRDMFTGLCEPCPDKAWMLLLAYFGGGLVLGLVVYRIYKKGPSVAAMGIAVDYFQILSIFADLNLGWPASLVTVFEYASVTAANVEVTSPECSINVSYAQKWFFFEATPIMFALTMVVGHILYTFKKIIAKKKGSKTKHLPSMLGIFLVSLNYLYLLLTRKAFEVFHCVDNGNGRQFLLADPSVFCDTDEYADLHNWAIVAVLSYGLGIPLVYAIILFKNASAIKVDQGLRLKGFSGSRASNPYYDMQKRYRRLYFKFRPESYYWNLIIILRKFTVVFLSMQVGEKPMFAASSTVFVLFSAFVLHIKKNPYRVHDPEEEDPSLTRLKAGKSQRRISIGSVDASSAGSRSPSHLQSNLSRRGLPLAAMDAANMDESEYSGAETGSGGERRGGREASDSIRSMLSQGETAQPLTATLGEREQIGPGGKKAALQRRSRKGLFKNAGMRVEARDRGGPKIKLKYLYDYNLLEATFLTCAVFVLLSGMMFKSSEFEGAARDVMEWSVMTIVVVSTLTCVVTVVAELGASMKYYAIAKKARKALERRKKSAKKRQQARMSMFVPPEGLGLTELEVRRYRAASAAVRARMGSIDDQAGSSAGAAAPKPRKWTKMFKRGGDDDVRTVNVDKMTNVARYEIVLRLVGVDELSEEGDLAIGQPVRMAFKLDQMTHKVDFVVASPPSKSVHVDAPERYVDIFRLDCFTPVSDVIHITLKDDRRIRRVLGTTAVAVVKNVKEHARDVRLRLKDPTGRPIGCVVVNTQLVPKQGATVENWSYVPKAPRRPQRARAGPGRGALAAAAAAKRAKRQPMVDATKSEPGAAALHPSKGDDADVKRIDFTNPLLHTTVEPEERPAAKDVADEPKSSGLRSRLRRATQAARSLGRSARHTAVAGIPKASGKHNPLHRRGKEPGAAAVELTAMSESGSGDGDVVRAGTNPMWSRGGGVGGLGGDATIRHPSA